MGEVIIRLVIEAPDGVNVRVEAPGNAPVSVAATSRSMPRQNPPGMCPDHGTDWRLVPAGVSKKTGRSYDAFWACPERGCNARPNWDDEAPVAAQNDLPF